MVFADCNYACDANGNMTSRKENSVTYSQSWTKENRVETISGNGQSLPRRR